jgi:PAS domain S-box-containing protein
MCMSAISDLCEQLRQLRERGFAGKVSLPATNDDERRLEAELNVLLEAARHDQAEAARRRAVEDRLSQQGVVLRSITDTIPYNVFWKDRDCRYLGCNRLFADIAGLKTPDDIIGLRDHDLPWASNAEPINVIDRRVMESGVAELRVEESFTAPDGSVGWGQICKVPLRDEQGHVCGVVGVHTDITQRKSLEHQLHEAKQQAESANRMKSEFFANVSHELRTPLTLISGPIESLLERKRDLPQWAEAHLSTVRRNAARLSVLVDDLLDLVKLEAGKAQLQWALVDLTALTRELVSDATATARARGIELGLAADELGRVPVDRKMYEKILLNLVSNALKFTPAGGKVQVGLCSDGDELELSVRDTGIGIPEDKLSLLFTRFQQLDSSSTRRYSGTGLGLALVRELADAMGGTISVESTLGTGTCFRVRLLRDPSRVRPVPDVIEPGNASLRSARVSQPVPASPSLGPGGADAANVVRDGRPLCLLAEDNADMRAYVAGVLESEYQVLPVQDGIEALALLARTIPDVVLSDVMMPGIDGLSLVRQIKADPKLRRVPVLLLTARAGQDAVVSSLDCGADDYLNKPFAPAELKARLRAARRAYALELTTDELRLGQAAVLAAARLETVTRVTSLVSEALAPYVLGSRPGSLNDVQVLEQRIGHMTQILEQLPKHVELPPSTAPVTVDLRELAADAVASLGSSMASACAIAPLAEPVLVSTSAGDVRQALARILRFAQQNPARVEQVPLELRVAVDLGVPTIAVRDPSARFSFEERSSLINGRSGLDIDLLIAHVLLSRSGGALQIDDEDVGSTLRIELDMLNMF